MNDLMCVCDNDEPFGGPMLLREYDMRRVVIAKCGEDFGICESDLEWTD